MGDKCHCLVQGHNLAFSRKDWGKPRRPSVKMVSVRILRDSVRCIVTIHNPRHLQAQWCVWFGFPYFKRKWRLYSIVMATCLPFPNNLWTVFKIFVKLVVIISLQVNPTYNIREVLQKVTFVLFNFLPIIIQTWRPCELLRSERHCSHVL
jgi:hypothetical protein